MFVGRRYRYASQPRVALWNIVCLANAIYPLVEDVDALEGVMPVYSETLDAARARIMAGKLGLLRLNDDEVSQSGVARDQLFIQTKFTFIDGQDSRLPYDADAPIATQVAQSFAKSLEHLGVTYLDSYVLHGPSQTHGLGDEDHEAWRAMEKLVEDRGVRVLGASNMTAQQIGELYNFARIKPANHERITEAERGGRVRILWETSPVEIHPDSVRLRGAAGDTTSLPTDQVFVLVGGELPTAFLRACGVEIETHFGRPMGD